VPPVVNPITNDVSVRETEEVKPAVDLDNFKK
jgi:hypothetical protein